MTQQYVGIEPLTMVRIGSDETATMAYVYAGAPVPEGADPDDLARLVEEGYLEARDVEDPQPDDGPTKIPEILKAVGSDKALAQQYLDEENAASKPRPTLVEKLQAVIDAEA